MRHGSKPTTNRGACGGTTVLAPGRQWASHIGRRQRMRPWLRAMRKIEALAENDAAAKAAREALLDAVADDPDPETAALNLGHAAMMAAEATRVPWAVAMMDLLRRFEERAKAGAGEGEDAASPA